MTSDKRVKIKPSVAGLVVRDPKTGDRLPDEGKKVSLTSYWRRRIKDGSVIVIG
jgi:hypothetical protein